MTGQSGLLLSDAMRKAMTNSLFESYMRGVIEGIKAARAPRKRGRPTGSRELIGLERAVDLVRIVEGGKARGLSVEAACIEARRNLEIVRKGVPTRPSARTVKRQYRAALKVIAASGISLPDK